MCHMMAQKGRYVAMVADDYGVEYTDATKYQSDPELFAVRHRLQSHLTVW